MRVVLGVLVLISGLVFATSALAQGTTGAPGPPGPGSAAPKQSTPPTRHRQPRPGDGGQGRAPADPLPAASDPGRSDLTDQDERLNRILNGICRGC